MFFTITMILALVTAIPGSPSDCQIQSSYVPAYGLQKHGTCGVDPQKLEKTGPFDP